MRRLSILSALVAVAVVLSVSVSFSQTLVDTAQTLLIQAGKRIVQDDYAGAKAIYVQVLALDSMRFEAIRNLGVCESALGDQEKAMYWLRKAFAIDPQDPDVNNDIGTILSRANKHEEAVPYFETAAKHRFDDAMVLTHLGMEYSRVGRLDEAAVALRRALKLDTTHPMPPYGMANLLATQKRYDSAEYYYNQSMQLGNKTAEAFYFRGISERYQNKLGKAEQSFRSALTIQPRYPEVAMALGLLYMQQKKYEDAIAPLSDAFKDDSTQGNALVVQGVAFAMLGYEKQADSVRAMLVSKGLAARMDGLLAKERAKD